MVLAASGYPLLNIFWTTLFVFAWVLWFWLLFRVYSDLFRRRDIDGGAKTGWVVFTLVLPFIGVFAYLISQGGGMVERSEREVAQRRAASDAPIRSVATDADMAQRDLAQRDLAQRDLAQRDLAQKTPR